MYYYKVLDGNGGVAFLLTYDQQPNTTDPSYIEITAEEYTAICDEINKKGKLAKQLYYGEITIDDVPEEWREGVQTAVDALIAERGEYVPQPTESELAVDEALAILRGEESE